MKAREVNASNFPVPAITICSSLFARESSANFYETNKKFFDRTPMNYSKQECERFSANLQWCQGNFGLMAKRVCSKYDILNIDVLKTLFESSLEVKLNFLTFFLIFKKS
jgi:hypothetical protein